jgi:hypothetical protein
MTVPAGRRFLAGEGTAARSWSAVVALATFGAGAGAGWLAARGWPAVRGVPDARGGLGLLAAMAVVLAAGNGYAKAYSP